MKIVFATNNQHKLEEIRQILGDSIEVLSLSDIGCHTDIPETGTTLEENARQKANYIWQHYHMSVFADDTGLEVDALDGAPGVYSARYAAMEPMGPMDMESASPMGSATPKSHDSEANMARLLRELGENNNRRVRFRTVIALLLENGDTITGQPLENTVTEKLFEGIVEGEITRERSGLKGFG